MIVFEYISYIIGGVGVVVIVWGVIKGLIVLVIAEFSNFRNQNTLSVELENRIRLGIGFYLVLGLEFLIGADIIRTIVEPTLEELGILGGIVAIRIALAYFLGRELGHFKTSPNE